MTSKITFFRWLAQAGYFGLMGSMYLLLFVFNKPEPQNMLPALIFHIGPLLFPLRGLLAAKAYTHAWAGYLALYYFIIGIWYAGAEVDRLIGMLITISSIVFFVGAIAFARLQGKADKLAAKAETTDQ
ncbi:MAG: DUF2069 domain-containing protein [Gammaproteobacteria bacterium]|nr:DUF2069 domain-containing protein [Gammaproteobacteria bacterium]